jgi:7-carboxy-7-deazaguanine synthase
MKVCEIFRSIQGESSHAGLPCAFIRLSGCNLRCSYCDTTYAYEGGEEYSLEGLIGEVSGMATGLVEVTGGEPLLQAGSAGLISRLSEEGFKVLVETNGSMSIKEIDRRATVIMDVKTPGSAMSGKTDLSNIALLKPADEVKFVLTDRADYEWAKDFINGHSLLDRCLVLMSPVFGGLHPEALSNWILQDGLPVMLNLQIHKYIFGPGRRAV